MLLGESDISFKQIYQGTKYSLHLFLYIMTMYEIMKIGKTKDISSHADLKEYSNSNF